MSALLLLCFWLALCLTVATAGLIVAPVQRFELAIWRRLRIQSVRHRLSRKRHAVEAFDPLVTLGMARRNLLWHLFFTGFFSLQLGVARVSNGTWWQPLAVLLIVPCAAYFVGSLIQRKKVVVLRLRSSRLRRSDV